MKTAAVIVQFLLALSFGRFAAAGEVRAPELSPLNAADISALAPDIRLPAAAIEDLAPRESLAPVIITVHGIRFDQLGWGPLETHSLTAFFHSIFNKESLNEASVAKGVAEYNKQFDILNEGGEFRPDTRNSGPMPDECLEEELGKLPEFSEGRVTFVPFQWSRDPDESNKVVPVFVEKLAAVYDTYKGTGRPIYILAHSWGSVLMHETMHRLGKVRPDVKIDKFVTVGSPLVPGNPFIKIFMTAQTTAEHLQTKVTKPAILGYWKNIWASRDPFSNEIKAADSNTQVDKKVPQFEPTLKDLILHNKELRDAAKNDFFALINFKAWHASYVYDFEASLKSLNKNVHVRVLKPIIVPQLEEGR